MSDAKYWGIDTSEEIEHYGVKGMKWRKHKWGVRPHGGARKHRNVYDSYDSKVRRKGDNEERFENWHYPDYLYVLNNKKNRHRFTVWRDLLDHKPGTNGTKMSRNWFLVKKNKQESIYDHSRPREQWAHKRK